MSGRPRAARRSKSSGLQGCPHRLQRTNWRGVGLEATEVLSVGSGRSLIDVNGGENVAACGLKAQAETSCTAEKIDNAEAPWNHGTALVNSGTRPLPRQEDPDTGSPPSPIGQSVNLAAVHLHDAASDGEAHSLPTFFARKQWLEHAVSYGVGIPGPLSEKMISHFCSKRRALIRIRGCRIP